MSSRVGVAGAVALLLLALASCVARPRCHVSQVPMAWTDGTLTVWTVTVCDVGAVRVVPNEAPR
jgi:hypothetical protein